MKHLTSFIFTNSLIPKSLSTRGILLFILMGLSGLLNAQNLHLTMFGGAANYQGDLQPKRFTFHQSHLALGFGAEYEVSDKIWLRTQFTFGKISADDKSFTQHADRNLNFTTAIQELQLTGQYLFRSLGDYRFTPYVFAGVAYFHFNPYTYDSSKTKYFLKPLSTEGEGFISGQKNYSLNQFSIPFGAGVKVNISPRFIFGLEMGFRKTFTDYLDDVSTIYVDQSAMFAAKGAKAVELAYRGAELKNGAPYPTAGTIRGGSAKKDLYYFAGATLTYKFRNIGKAKAEDKKNVIECPKN